MKRASASRKLKFMMSLTAATNICIYAVDNMQKVRDKPVV